MRDSLKTLVWLLLLVVYVSASDPVTNRKKYAYITSLAVLSATRSVPGTNATVATK